MFGQSSPTRRRRDAAELAVRVAASIVTEARSNSKARAVPTESLLLEAREGIVRERSSRRLQKLELDRKMQAAVDRREVERREAEERRIRAGHVAAAVFEMDDALETILFSADRITLASAKAVTRRWARHARAQFGHPLWQARHLTLTELISEWRPRRSWPSDAALIRRLQSASLDERSAKDDEGRSLLHLALSRPFDPRSHEVVAALIKACPLLVTAADEAGRLPLHYAAASSARVETVELLVWSCPESVDRKDQKGHFPITAALQHVRNGRLGRGLSGHSRLIRPHPKAHGCSTYSGGEA